MRVYTIYGVRQCVVPRWWYITTEQSKHALYLHAHNMQTNPKRRVAWRNVNNDVNVFWYTTDCLQLCLFVFLVDVVRHCLCLVTDISLVCLQSLYSRLSQATMYNVHQSKKMFICCIHISCRAAHPHCETQWTVWAWGTRACAMCCSSYTSAWNALEIFMIMRYINLHLHYVVAIHRLL